MRSEPRCGNSAEIRISFRFRRERIGLQLKVEEVTAPTAVICGFSVKECAACTVLKRLSTQYGKPLNHRLVNVTNVTALHLQPRVAACCTVNQSKHSWKWKKVEVEEVRER